MIRFRKYDLLLLLWLIAPVMRATPQQQTAVQGPIQWINNVFYWLNEDYTATILDSYQYGGKSYYQQETIEVLPTVFHGGPSVGGGQSGYTYRITELGQRAFKGAKCKTLTFAMPSNVMVIGEEALSNMPNLSQDTLTLPASLDSLALGAVVLPNIRYIVFLGTTPPRCAVAPGEDAFNPWTSASEITMPTVQVLVPEGTWSKYKEAKGIGDYFSCFQGETPTGVTEAENTPTKACKVMRNGQLLIQKAGSFYTLEGQIVEK